MNRLLQVQLWSFRGTEGDYQVLLTVKSLVLLESRCAECYSIGGGSFQRDSCCDGNNTESCPDSCDILLKFCRLSDLLQSPLASTINGPFGVQCEKTPLSSHFEEWLGNDFKRGETYPDFGMGLFQGVGTFGTPMKYDETGEWVNLAKLYFSMDSIILKYEILLHREEHN